MHSHSANETAAIDRPRVRFAPSPTGYLHLGVIRTALYNWAYARHTGGTFVFRIEDTDPERSTEEYYHSAVDTMRWLGLGWDEGVEVGGPYGPYRQRDRIERYRELLTDLADRGLVYRDYATPAELAAHREACKRAGRPTGNDAFTRNLTTSQMAAYEAEARPFVWRFRMPDGETTFTDLVRGEITFRHEFVPDFALTRSDGGFLYTLAVVADDIDMRITHVLRGEDLLSSTPRQLALMRALGVPEERLPAYGHLPYVMGQDNAKLSKRHGEVSIEWYRRHGFLPEGLLNYLALLGWSIAEDRDVFTLAEMSEAFDVARVSRNPARFDPKKLLAINAEHIRRLPDVELSRRIAAELHREGLVSEPPTESEQRVLDLGTPLVRERISLLTEAAEMLRFALVSEERFAVDPEAAARVLVGERASDVLLAAADVLGRVETFETAAIEAALKQRLVEGLGHKPRVAFGPVRVAVTGHTVSPPLYESIEILGRERTLRRLRAAVDVVAAG